MGRARIPMELQLAGRRPLATFIRRDASELHTLAKKEGLDLSAAVVSLDPRGILVWQEIDEETVDRMSQSIRLARGWPEDMPLIVVGRRPDGTHEVVDGNHRRAAAIQTGLDSIPALEIDIETVDFMTALGVTGVALDTIMEAFALESPWMDRNQDLRWMRGDLD